MKKLGFLLLALLWAGSARADLLAGVFQDHAVLQRDGPIRVWGRAQPDAAVTVSLGGNTIETRADADGSWRASLPATPAGGPYVLTAKSGVVEEDVRDVLVGDVWLCSGQSNMVLQVRRTLDSRAEIENANNDRIRMFTVPDVASAKPLGEFPQKPEWLPTTPATVGDFSATCYYFARELQKKVDVPLGLINAAWGGSKIRTWMSSGALHQNGAFDDGLNTLALYAEDPVRGAAPFGAVWETWWKAHANGSEPWSPAFDVSAWPQAPKLGWWDDWGIPQLVDRTGMVWYRTTIDLSPAQASQDASLSIGAVDEIDATWVNGVFVGGGSGGNRTYRLPAGLLHPGTNTIAVNILNTYKQGGLLGPANAQGVHLADGNIVPLPGPWRYDLVPQSLGDPPRAPWESLAGLGVAYNGMIAPLGPYGLKGVVWYQGESDTGEAQAYEKLLAGLMADWRKRFDRDLPFLVVQLPDYGMPSPKPVASGWSKLREAQRAAVAADRNAALVVTIDIGERYDVHPANKQEVGRRLALAARHLVYGENVVAEGPVAESAMRIGRNIAVHFGEVENGLVAYGAPEPIGFELCAGAENSCRYVAAQIANGSVVIPLRARIKDAHVRYCWGDGPICTLFDGAGLPAAPFDLPVIATTHRLAAKVHGRRATLTKSAAPLR